MSILHSSSKELFKKTERKLSSDTSTVINKERGQNNRKISLDA